jgi:O-antigen ligase
MPSYGRSADYWIGITRYKNELSGTMAMAATLFLDMAVYGRKYRWAAFTGFGIALLLLVLSKGKGSLGMFGVMLFLFPLYRIAQQQYKTRVFLGISAALMLGVLTVAIFSNLEFIVVDILEKDMGGNGRDQVWTYLIQRALEKPWLGYGYGGFWTNPEEGLGVALAFPWIEGAGTGGGNAHSSYIDLFLQLGWLGVSLMSLSVLMVFVKIVLLLNITKKIEYFFMIQSLMILLVTSYSESYSGFISPRHLFWVLYVSNAFSTAIHLNRITKKVPSKLINSENTIEKYS